MVSPTETIPQSTLCCLRHRSTELFRWQLRESGETVLGVNKYDNRKGRFIREKAEKLGVPEGPKFSRLHSGESVELDDGRTIDSDQVVGPPRPGRSIVYTGKTRPAEEVVDAAEDVDLLIHDGAYTNSQSNKAQKSGHSTAKQAGEIAAHSSAKRLALVHFSGRYESNDTHVDEAENAAPDTEVFGAEDGQDIHIQLENVENEYSPKSDLQEQATTLLGIEEQAVDTAEDSPSKPMQQAVAATEHIEKEWSEGTTLDLAALRKQAEEEAREEVEVTTNSSPQQSTEYSRSEAVKKYVKARASGHCEGCNDPAPFKSKTGEPYLHAHHVFELSGGGSDTPDTVVALCPNCHYRVHHGQDGDEYNECLYEKVQRLEKET